MSGVTRASVGRLRFLLLGLGLALVGCSAAQAPSLSVGTTHAPAAHWTYEGEDGPDHWGELSADYETCASGHSQSPVDVANPDPADLANITFNYRPAPLEIVNNGHTVQVNYPVGSSITVDGTNYELLQFHFHAPSEHHVDGTSAAAELHLVHRDADGALAVIGVLLTEGAPSPALAPVFDNLPPQAGPAQPVPGVQVDPHRHAAAGPNDLSLSRVADHAAVHRGRGLAVDDRAAGGVGRSTGGLHTDLRGQQPPGSAAQRSGGC